VQDIAKVLLILKKKKKKFKKVNKEEKRRLWNAECLGRVDALQGG